METEFVILEKSFVQLDAYIICVCLLLAVRDTLLESSEQNVSEHILSLFSLVIAREEFGFHGLNSP